MPKKLAALDIYDNQMAFDVAMPKVLESCPVCFHEYAVFYITADPEEKKLV